MVFDREGTRSVVTANLNHQQVGAGSQARQGSSKVAGEGEVRLKFEL